MLSDDLLELQRLDTTSDQLKNRRARLPEREPAALASAALGSSRQRRQAISDRDAELDAAIEGLEHDGAAIQHHRDRLQGQLKTVIAPREAEALMHELDTLKERRDGLDETELAYLEEQSSLADERAALEAAEPQLLISADEAAETLRRAEASVDAELAELATARSALIAMLDPAAVANYERLRERFGGVAVARLEGRRCSGCNLDLAAGELDQVRATPPGEVADCPECGRMLIP